jgi:hypothetical protein
LAWFESTKISKKKALDGGIFIDSRIYLNLKEALNLNNFTDQNSANKF